MLKAVVGGILKWFPGEARRRLTVGRSGLHHALRIVLKKFARRGGEQLEFFGKKQCFVRRREEGMRLFHFAVLDKHHEIVCSDHGMPEVRLLERLHFSEGFSRFAFREQGEGIGRTGGGV